MDTVDIDEPHAEPQDDSGDDDSQMWCPQCGAEPAGTVSTGLCPHCVSANWRDNLSERIRRFTETTGIWIPSQS